MKKYLFLMFISISSITHAGQYDAISSNNDTLNQKRYGAVQEEIQGKLDVYYVNSHNVKAMKEGAKVKTDTTNAQLISAKRTVVDRKGSAIHEKWTNTYMTLTKEVESNSGQMFNFDMSTSEWTETVDVYKDEQGNVITAYEYATITIPFDLTGSTTSTTGSTSGSGSTGSTGGSGGSTTTTYSLANCTPTSAPYSLTGSVTLKYYYVCDGKKVWFNEPLK
ncbi:hypothetical protein CFI10_11445 [Marinobacterium iners]|uniref:hypothetical protein n=1 Tax=Marinobacterium iners TaxID=48076 RepID=UPI001A8CFB3C|nr:hypothetical protein [Marinobacterium iners]QSR35603.1 hypothetical protein CFI10_11445 [Marinobacterium iners]